MVDFKKLLGKKKITKPTDPIEIFSDLDKESGKEYLRPPQKSVLEEWYSMHAFTLSNTQVKHEQLRKKLKEIGYKPETVDKVIELYTK